MDGCDVYCLFLQFPNMNNSVKEMGHPWDQMDDGINVEETVEWWFSEWIWRLWQQQDDYADGLCVVDYRRRIRLAGNRYRVPFRLVT